MCIPTCAHPDGPPCYKVRQLYSQSSHYNQGQPGPGAFTASSSNEVVPVPLSDSKVLTGTHICNGCDLYANQLDESREDDADLGNDQATLRREKSRVAAKLRRQKENQALVKLRLALPIQSSKLPTGAAKDAAQPCDARAPVTYADTQQQEHSQSRVLSECALSCVPNYRAANSISRQHHLAAPEFEKAVTIRLAGNALCLYDWLYTTPAMTGSAKLDRSQALVRRSHPNCACACASRLSEVRRNGPAPSLSLFSQSLLAVVVDTTENTIVYAPPSYAELIGVSWNTIIGIYLYELRSKQFSSTISAQLINSQLSKSRVSDAAQQSSCSSTSKPQSLHETSPNSFSSDTGMSGTGALDSTAVAVDLGSPKPRSRNRKTASVPKRLSKSSLQLLPQPALYAELWTRTDSDSSFAPITTLLPPGPNVAQLFGHLLLDEVNNSGTTTTTTTATMDSVCSSDGGEQPSPTPIIQQSFTEDSEMFAVCWAAIPLPAQSCPSYSPAKAVFHERGQSRAELDNPMSSTCSPSISSPSASSSSRSALCVYLLNPVSLQTASNPDLDGLFRTGFAVGASTDLPEFTTSPRCGLTGLGCAPRTYHARDDLTFLRVHSDFLTALDLSRDRVLDSSLLDFVHPDDLDAICTALSLITETNPIITSFYRIRHGSGRYRWSRLIGKLSTGRSAERPQHAGEDQNGPGSQASGSAQDAATTSSLSSTSSVSSCGEQAKSHDPATETEGTQSAVLVCWHQFLHFHYSEDPTTVQTKQENPCESQLRICCALSADNDDVYPPGANACTYRQELFPSPGCDPRRSTVDNRCYYLRQAHLDRPCQPTCCHSCPSCSIFTRCGSAKNTSSVPSRLFDRSAPAVSRSCRLTNPHHDCHHRCRIPTANYSPTPRQSFPPSVTPATTHNMLCAPHNTLSAYDNLELDAWDTDGVTLVEDELVHLCSQGLSESADQSPTVLCPPPPPPPRYRPQSASRSYPPKMESEPKSIDSLTEVKILSSRTAFEDKVDWARQAPSINPDLGDYELPGDLPNFCPSQRCESSEPSSTDADSFVLTPGLDQGTQTPRAPSCFSIPPTTPSSASCVRTAPTFVVDEEDLVELPRCTEPNVINPCRRSYSCIQGSYPLPQAEIYSVPTGYCKLHRRDNLIDDSVDYGVLTKRRRYTVQSSDPDAEYVCNAASITKPCMRSELPRSTSTHCVPPSNTVPSPLLPIGSPEFDLSVSLHGCPSSLTEFASSDPMWDQTYFQSSVGLPTLRRLLNTEVTETYPTAHDLPP